MNLSSSVNADGALAVSTADSKPTMAKGSGSGATWTADAALQDVLLTSNTAETENSYVSDDADIKVQEDSHVDANDPSAAAASAAAGAGASVGTTTFDPTVDKVIRILGLLPATKVCLKKEYPTQKLFEEFLQLSSEEVRANTMAEEGDKVDKEEDGGDTYKKGKKDLRARFNQADRAKLILIGRWTESNLNVHGHEIQWEDFNKKSFNDFVRKEVDDIILDEILDELKLSKEVKETLKDNGVHTPAGFVEKSKYWYEHEIKLSSRHISEIEKVKRWYKYQLDTYLPSDWIMAFREEAAQVNDLEWRKVLKAIGIKADAIQALEINDISDFASLIYTSEKWRINGPRESNDWSMPEWNEWQKLGLKEKDARNIINFRHWHKFYVAGMKDKNDWTAEFNTAHYKRFVQRYIDPNKLDEEPGWFKSAWKPGWWTSKNDDSLKTSKEKKDYLDMLERAAEDGAVTEEVRYRLKAHFDGRREKMDLIQEINEGSGDKSFQEERLNQIFKDEAEDQTGDEEASLFFTKQYCQFVFSALVAYLILLIWVGTSIDFMVITLTRKFKLDEFPYTIFVNNISFGLVTAVVIQELGEGAQDSKSSLYNRFLATYKKRTQRSKEVRFKNWLKLRSIRRGRFFSFSAKEGGIGLLFNYALTFIWEINYNFFTWLILSSARIYIVGWIITGALSLIMGVATNLDATNPLYTTGQTWVGIAVTIGYSFFGLERKKAPKDETDQMNNNADQGANGRGDGAEAESREEAKYTNERGETKDIKTRHELMKELESQLAEAEEEMRAAIEEGDIDGEVNLHKKVIKLKRKLKEETKATAGGDANSS
mmetsp:Transcript_37171/g.75838  ORF Transcript_37171/g.75838 Transcript_37171/m.75838 type:complete len:827 (-) Transcript_37171:3061-5541(-)|eukprot:CAMPEP_0113431860 /NCGR_PEP_ID=MMETSP0013_2-20120614/33814_1 /TAXON_ID=2843 ORGANISM="Skeletonema costatum, Strain 1716" /NCGR_SAMPLE_ID=MMETSP0013_2 /ASSEMBLY_ACC=CAM_ASM_000158 /LENGTH=826 /DNA_ID=CAMNT_0000320889 /DNA_START=118 /DNA_END=2601 /DNA_ORIENTATION=+ /assembly_acc=CAM_ASM_000158